MGDYGSFTLEIRPEPEGEDPLVEFRSFPPADPYMPAYR
jgi:hypothetical protein